MGQLVTILYLATISATIFLTCYIIWRIVWFKKYGVEIPIDRNFNIQEINQRKLFYKTKTFDVFITFFTKILSKLDMDYWVTQTGTDGYVYLLFQRRFLKLTLVLSVISLCVSIPTNVTSGNNVEDWFERTTLNNKELTKWRSWVHVVLVLVFTLLTIRAVQKTRRDAKIAYLFYYREMSRNKDHEWLKARTVHVKGIPPEDRSGNSLKVALERVLAPIGGQVLAVLLVPDFVSQLKIESQILDLNDLQILLSAKGSSNERFSNVFIPRKYKDPQNFQLQMDKLEQKLLEETLKPFKPSGHAFVCFDSVKSVHEVVNKFKIGPVNYMKLVFQHLKHKINSCLHTQSRERVQSTFIKFETIDVQAQMYGVDEEFLMVNIASEPMDLLWKNMGGTRGLYIFRRIFLYLMGLFIIFFVSTPTAFLSSLKYLDVLGIFEFQWTENLPFGQFLKAHLPPLMILTINQILLFLIDISSIVEKHETHSHYQRSIFTKAVVYLNLNMLIMPALTLTNAEPLIDIIFKKHFDITKLLGNFYIANSGIFFVSILIQQAFFSSSFYLLNISDVCFSYFSPWLALEKRKIFNDSAPWRRKENFCFQYGYFYAQMMAAFAICLVFSSTVPLVTIAGCLFLWLRHIVDSFQLITYYRKEIDSSGRLISTVTNSALLLVILYQMAMMAFFIIKRKPAEAFAVTLILVICILFTVISYEDVYDLSKIEEENEGGKVFNDEAFQKWKSEYEHPLVVGSVKRKAQTLGVETKTVNDWTQFLEDKDVQGILFSPHQRYRKSGFFSMSEEFKESSGASQNH